MSNLETISFEQWLGDKFDQETHPKSLKPTDVSIKHLLTRRDYGGAIMRGMSLSIKSIRGDKPAIYCCVGDIAPRLGLPLAQYDRQGYVVLRKPGVLRGSDVISIRVRLKDGSRRRVELHLDQLKQAVSDINPKAKNISLVIADDKLFTGETAYIAAAALEDQTVSEALGGIKLIVEAIVVVAAQAKGIKFLNDNFGMPASKIGELVRLNEAESGQRYEVDETVRRGVYDHLITRTGVERKQHHQHRPSLTEVFGRPQTAPPTRSDDPQRPYCGKACVLV